VSEAELVGVALFGLATAMAGLGLVIRAHAAVPGTLLACGGVAVLVGVAASRTAPDWVADLLYTAAGTLLLPLAVSTYPRPTWRHPVDFLALCVITGAGSLAAASSTSDAAWSRADVLAPAAGVVASASLLHLWWRMERADQADRRPLVWMALTLAVTGTIYFFVVFALEGVSSESTGRGLLIGFAFGVLGLIGPSMYIGLLRPEVVDVRGLVVGAAVFGTAVVAYMAVYGSIQAALELLAGEPPSVGTMALVAALVAATFHPLQVAMRGVIDELLFGRRPDPLGAAGHVAENIGDDPALALEAIREALVLPYAQLLVGGRILATSGVAVTHTRSLPLALGDDRTGELVVGLRPGDLNLTQSDQHVLDLARPLLAQSLRAQLLADALQESREQAITAIEEERRRLRRDLHDGLGPRLSGIAFTSDAAGNTLKDDPDSAAELLRGLRAETVTAIQEIRQLVYGMRPPALDELGLVPAIRQQAEVLRTADGRPMRVDLEAEKLPALTAALEVAAYRIAVEALANAARHSGSDEASARLRVRNGSLHLEVRDRGGSNGQWRRGVGLSSMQERAAELGGTLEAGYADGGGRVLAVLPL
jgi:signal transduction histidine kinase